ncbi:hypothetical protein [Polynucleobacter sp. MWH-UH35A]|uniref:hypothetical protein n=1 Tax=Polynucleobacter sp. MWH-UH35A TaxID=1855619 RepID=UPI001BFE51AB|nr:hypothetical protein [Polynucleobacter sp. MWH-UH35A]QWD60444.1 hypothetical protein ICV36_01760 [Polynucleobacter sp. MWH-UH35A]
MSQKSELMFVVGFSRLAQKVTQRPDFKKYKKIVISRRSVKGISSKKIDTIKYKNRKKIKQLISKYRSIIVLNTSANYGPRKFNACSMVDGNHLFPKKILEYIPRNKITKVINIDTALNKFENYYSARKKKHFNWLRCYALKRKISLINLVAESYYYLDGSPGSLIDYLYHCMQNSVVAKIRNGDHQRDFVSANQLFYAIKRSVDIRLRKGSLRKINICTGKLYKIKDIPKILENKFNKTIEVEIETYPSKKMQQVFRSKSQYKLETFIKKGVKNLEEDMQIRGTI